MLYRVHHSERRKSYLNNEDLTSHKSAALARIGSFVTVPPPWEEIFRITEEWG